MHPTTQHLVKLLDRTLGRLAVRLSNPRAAESLPPPTPAQVRRVVVIRPGGIGDAILLVPLLRALRWHYPQAALDLVAETRNAAALRATGLARQVYCYDRELPALLRSFRREPTDLLVDSEQYHYLSGWIGSLSGAPWRCGFASNERAGFFTHPVPYQVRRYEAESFLDLFTAISSIEVTFRRDQHFLPVGEEHLRPVLSAYPQLTERPHLALSPAASVERKRWPVSRFRRVAEWALGEGLGVVVLGGEDTRSEGRALSELPGVLDLTGRCSLAQSIAVLGLSRAFLCGDTGLLHAGYGVGVPLVQLFGPGIVEKWAAPGPQARTLARNLPCSPCMMYGRMARCYSGYACMQEITEHSAIAALAECLQGSAGSWEARVQRLLAGPGELPLPFVVGERS